VRADVGAGIGYPPALHPKDEPRDARQEADMAKNIQWYYHRKG